MRTGAPLDRIPLTLHAASEFCRSAYTINLNKVVSNLE